METELRDFLTAVRRSPAIWNSLDIRILAVEIKGVLHNALTTCTLRFDEPQQRDSPRAPQQVGPLVLRHIYRPVNDLDSIAHAISEGDLNLDGHSILYQQYDSEELTNPRPYRHRSFYEPDVTSPFRRSGWSRLSWSAEGEQVGKFLKRVNWDRTRVDAALLAAERPINGVEGLIYWLKGRDDIRFDSRTPFEDVSAEVRFRADFEIGFDPSLCSLHAGTVSVALRGRAEPIADFVSVALTWHDDERHPKHTMIDVPANQTVHQPVGQIRRGTLLLRIGSYCVDRLELVDYGLTGDNHRVTVHRLFDPDLENLRISLKPKQNSSSTEFEGAVGRLLALAGFVVETLGGARGIGDAPDVLAYVPDSNVIIVVECTNGSIDAGGKLGKLGMRADTIRKALPPARVLPVLVTSLGRDGLSKHELDKAGADRISVIAAEEIEELIRKSLEGEAVKASLQFLFEKIPPAPPKPRPMSLLRGR